MAHSGTCTIEFAFDASQIRIIWRDGDPWFVLADVCRALGVGNPSMVAKKLDEDERAILPINVIDRKDRNRETLIVSESGLYTIMLRSNEAIKPGTLTYRFRRWVTKELLPTLRKRGVYALRPPERTLSPPQALDADIGRHFRFRMRNEFARIEAQWVREAAAGVEPYTMQRFLVLNKASMKKLIGYYGIPDDDALLTEEATVRKLYFVMFQTIGLDVDYIFRGQRTITDDEREMLDAYRRASPADRADARALFERLPDYHVADRLMALDAGLKCGMIGRSEHAAGIKELTKL